MSSRSKFAGKLGGGRGGGVCPLFLPLDPPLVRINSPFQKYLMLQNPHSGNLKLSQDKRNVYYHPLVHMALFNVCNFKPAQHINFDSGEDSLFPSYRDLLRSELWIVMHFAIS